MSKGHVSRYNAKDCSSKKETRWTCNYKKKTAWSHTRHHTNPFLFSLLSSKVTVFRNYFFVLFLMLLLFLISLRRDLSFCKKKKKAECKRHKLFP